MHYGPSADFLKASYVTTMIDKYFGVPQAVFRDGIWREMKPTEQSLYVCLWHESERYRTREIHRTDAQLHALGNLSSRSLCNARKKLQERGLVLCKRANGNRYVYTLCNPKTGFPWSDDPRQPIAYVKKAERRVASVGTWQLATKAPTQAEQQNAPANRRAPGSKMSELAKVSGVPLSF